MDSKLFKAFTPYLNVAPDWRKLDLQSIDALEDNEVVDPTPTSWSSTGIVDLGGNEFAMDVQGAAMLVGVQFNERILPGAVQKEKMLAKLAHIEEQTGRKPGKKEYAQIRDDVAFELLPQAFIKRKVVPIMFIKDKVLVFTSSAKKADDAIALLYRVIGSDDLFVPTLLSNRVVGNITGRLTELAKDGGHEGPLDERLETTSSVVLKGENKQTIRIKDKAVGSDDVSTLLKQSYDVASLGLAYLDPDDVDESASFVMSEKLIVSRLAVVDSDTVRGKDAKDEQATALATMWMVALATNKIVDLVIDLMDGLRTGEDQPEPAATPETQAEPEYDVDDL